ncbi:MAG: conjugative transposon protein TraM [Phycisphaerales bacterium]|nr:conjugative transposon protein TraM [Phycisphaerales bacterium]
MNKKTVKIVIVSIAMFFIVMFMLFSLFKDSKNQIKKNETSIGEVKVDGNEGVNDYKDSSYSEPLATKKKSEHEVDTISINRTDTLKEIINRANATINNLKNLKGSPKKHGKENNNDNNEKKVSTYLDLSDEFEKEINKKEKNSSIEALPKQIEIVKIPVYVDGAQTIGDGELLRLRLGKSFLGLPSGALFFCDIAYGSNRLNLSPANIVNDGNIIDISNYKLIDNNDGKSGINIQGLSVKEDISNSAVDVGGSALTIGSGMVGAVGQLVGGTVGAISKALKGKGKVSVADNYKLYLIQK